MTGIYFLWPQKVAAMQNDPRVTLLVDDRQNLARDIAQGPAVTAHGTAAPLDPARHSVFAAQYRNRPPYLEDFLTAPSGNYHRIAVHRHDLDSDFQRVDELTLQ